MEQIDVTNLRTKNPGVSQTVNGGSVMLKPKKNSGVTIAVASFAIVLLGLGTGWLLSGGKTETKTEQVNIEGTQQNPGEAGVGDESQFSAEVEGVLEEGGIDGEGTHHVVRPGGQSQTAYLTSNVIDLQRFVGKKVKVWGTTMSSKKAGWLIEAGKIKEIK